MKKNGFGLAQFTFDHKKYTQIPNHKPNTQGSDKPSLNRVQKQDKRWRELIYA